MDPPVNYHWGNPTVGIKFDHSLCGYEFLFPGKSRNHLLKIDLKFNGKCLAALGLVPFGLSGWISGRTGEEYVGTLTHNGVVLQNIDGASPDNQIQKLIAYRRNNTDGIQ